MLLLGVVHFRGSPFGESAGVVHGLGVSVLSINKLNWVIKIKLVRKTSKTGLQITNGQAPVMLSSQTCFCLDMTRFWPVKLKQ